MTEKYGDGSRGLVHGPAYESAEVQDHYFVDGFSTQLYYHTERSFANKPTTHFLALGL